MGLKPWGRNFTRWVTRCFKGNNFGRSHGSSDAERCARGGTLWQVLALLVLAQLPNMAVAQVQRSFINPGFEDPSLSPNGCRVYINASLVPGWSTTHPEYAPGASGCTAGMNLGVTGPIIEIWRTPRNNASGGEVKAPEGTQIAELNAERASRLYQSICLRNGEKVGWSFNHRGRVNNAADSTKFDVAKMLVGSSSQVVQVGTSNNGVRQPVQVLQGTASDAAVAGNTSWALYKGEFTYQGATGGTNIGFEAVSAGSGNDTSGNFLDNVQIQLTPFVDFVSGSSADMEGNSGSNLLANRPVIRVNGYVAAAFDISVKVTGGSAVRGTDYFTNSATGTGDTLTIRVEAGTYDGINSGLFPLPIYVAGNTGLNADKSIDLAIQPHANSAFALESNASCGGVVQSTSRYTIIDDDGQLTVTKTASDPVPVNGSLTQYDIEYSIAVRNTSKESKTYELVDTPGFDADVSGISLQALTCAASVGNCGGTSAATLGSAPNPAWILRTSHALAAGRTETYTLKVRFTINPGVKGADTCNASAGAGLYNRVLAKISDGAEMTASDCRNTPTPAWVSLNKKLTARVNSNDQFQVRMASGGIPASSALTSGTSTSASTGQVAVSSGATVQFAESLKTNGTGADTKPTGYTALLSCSNATAGSLTVFPVNEPGQEQATQLQWNEFKPAPGDVLDCTITNTPIPPNPPQLTATKTVSASPLVADVAGQYYQLQLTVTQGPTTAPITIADNLPTGITLFATPTMSPSPNLLSGCADAGSSSVGACQINAGLANGTYTVKIPVNVSASAVSAGASNTAHLSGGGDPQCTSSNAKCNPSTGTVQVEQQIDLRIAKTATPNGTYVPDQSLSYSIVVSNNGPSDATGVTVTDAVPPEVIVSNWSCAPVANCGSAASGTGNNVQLSNVSLAKGQSLTITITGKAADSATGDIKNQATVTPPAGATCASTCESSSSTTNTNSGKPALGIVKTAAPEAFAVGQNGTYGISVTNTGTSSTSGLITVTDNMPTGVTIRQPVASNVSGSGWDCSASTANQLVCTTSAVLNPKVNAEIIHANVQVAAPFTGSSAVNQATVSGGGADCSAAGACRTSVTTPVNAPALTVEKVLQGTLKEGVAASYLITVTNNGQAATVGGTVTDVVPASLTINAYPSSCRAAAQVLTCDVPADLGIGEQVSYTIGVTPKAGSAGSAVANTAEAGSDTGDASCPAAQRCNSTTNNTVLAPELAISKRAEPSSFTLNVPAKYVLTVTNNGDANTSAGAPVIVSDTLPGGLLLDAGHALPVGCTSSGQTISCAITSLASKASQALDIWVIATDVNLIGKSVINTATVTGGGDPVCTSSMTAATLPQRCQSSVSTPVNAPKLQLAKATGDGGDFAVGVKSSYVLTVTNVGSAVSSGKITVYDLIPSALTVDQSTLPQGCSLAGVQLTCESTAELEVAPAAGSSQSFTIQVTPQAGSPATLVNNASVLGGGDPLCPSASNPDCSAQVTTKVATPTLTLTKADNGFSVVNGAGAAYTLTVRNTSASVDTVGAITVRDTLPAGVTAVAGTYGNWVCTVNGQALSCTSSASIAHGASDTITLPVTVTAAAVPSGSTSASLVNNASVGGGGDPFNGGTPPEPGAACTTLDAAVPGHCATTSTTVYTEAALGISKTFNSITQTGLGQYQATYTVTVSNSGGVAGSYTLTDTPGFAAGVVLNGWTVTSAKGSVNAPLPALINGVEHQISTTATAIAAGDTHSYSVVITFTASSSTAAASLTCSGTPGNGAYNAASIGSAAPAASACGALPGVPNLTLDKTSNGPWSAGQTGAQYVLTVTNVGNAVTSGTTKVVDTLPTGVSAVNTTSNGWVCTMSGQAVTCETTAALAVGTPSLIALPVTLSSTLVSSTGVVNIASVGGGGDPNNGGEPPTPGSCAAGDLHCASVTTPVGLKADLRITKVSAQGTQYVPDQPLNYTIEVFNDGPSTVEGASVVDNVPAKVKVSAWSCVATGAASCGPTVTGSTNTVSLTDVKLAKGEKLTITIEGKAELNATGDITNEAKVTPPATVTCTQSPCEKTASVTNKNAGTPALAIQKQALPTTFAVGQSGSYAIVVRNSGTTSTSGVITVTDRMPAGITITAIEPNSMWACSVTSGTDLTCTTTEVLLPAAAAPVILARVAVANTVATPAVNTASVTGGSTACTTQTPCTVTVQTNVDRPHLDISKKLNGSFVVGQPASYTITVTNNGRADTVGGAITDKVPAGLTVGDLSASACSANGNVVTCAVGAGLKPGSSKTFTIPVTPLASADGTSQLNQAVADGDTGDSTCPIATHCTGTTDDPVTAPQLVLTKTASAAAFTVGQAASYTLTVANNGTAATTANTVVTDVVPAGLRLDAVASTLGTCQAVVPGEQTVSCTVPGLATGASASITITVTPLAAADGLTMVNQATATGGGDPLCAAGSATASLPARCAPSINTPVNAPHLKLEKTAGMAEFSVGVASSYELKLTNVGTAETSGTITLVDVMPPSMTVGDLASVPACQLAGSPVQQLTCEFSQVLQPGESLNISIPVTPTVAAAPSVSNSAQVFGGGDPICPMDASCQSSVTTVVNAPDLHLIKTDNGPWTVDQKGAKYILTVHNSSPVAATVGEIDINVLDIMPSGILPDWQNPMRDGHWICEAQGQHVSCVSEPGFVIAANAQSSIELPVLVTAASIAPETSAQVANHASVSGGGDPFSDGSTPEPGKSCMELDPNDPGHCATRMTTVFALADMVVQKTATALNPTGVPGEYQALYTIEVNNLGGSEGAYTLSDMPEFASGATLLGWTVQTTGGALAAPMAAPVNGTAAQISASDVILPAGTKHSYEVTLSFSVSAGMANAACTGAAGNGAFNTASMVGTSVGASSACTALPGVPSLALSKQSSAKSWSVDQADASYTLTVRNLGTVPTSGTITVVDEMPAGLTFVRSSAANWSCAAAGQTVTCTSAQVLAAGAASSFDLAVQVSAAVVGNVINQAAVGGGGDPSNGGKPPVPGNCANGDSHCANASTTVTALAELTLSKTNHQTSLKAGSTTTYTVTISNPGSSAATGLSWTDQVVSGLDQVAIVGSTASDGSNAGNCAGLSCSGITVAAGGSVVYQVSAVVSGKAGEQAVNTATLTGGACTAQTPCTDTDSDPITSVTSGGAEPAPVPVDSRSMLVLLALAVLALAGALKQRGKR